MQIKVKPLVVAMSLALSACNSSNTNEPTNTNSEPTIITTTSLAGIVSDGYIAGATVCLDINENSRCDAGEPVAISGNGGKYILNNINTADENHSLIAVVGTDSQDADGRNFVHRTIFSAPKGEAGVISPFSTLVHNKLKGDVNLTLEQAKASVIAELGLNISTDELLADYIAKEIAEVQAQGVTETKYRDMHRAAQLLTTLMGSELVAEKEASGNFSDLDEGVTFEVVVDKILSEVDPETQKTIIAEVKDKVEEEKENSIADFTSFDKTDLGNKGASTCLVPQPLKQDDDNEDNEGNEGNEDNEDNEGNEGNDDNDDNEVNVNNESNDELPVNSGSGCIDPVTPVTPAVPDTSAGKALYTQTKSRCRI